MRADTRRNAVALLRRLRRVAAVNVMARLEDVRGRERAAFAVACRALYATGYYDRVRRPTMVRDIDRAIKSIAAQGWEE